MALPRRRLFVGLLLAAVAAYSTAALMQRTQTVVDESASHPHTRVLGLLTAPPDWAATA